MSAWGLFRLLFFSLALHSEAKIAADFDIDHLRIPIAQTHTDLR